jgi:predicted nucleic acid-binding protein
LIICDASAVIAVLDGSERLHEAARAALDDEDGPLVLSPFVCAEIDYLVGRRRGVDAETAFLAIVADDTFRLAPFGPGDVARAIGVIDRYRDLDVGLADASIVVLAERFRTRKIYTLDRRHFDAMRPLQGGRFEVLPAA